MLPLAAVLDERALILIANDDGVAASGLLTLVAALRVRCHVVACAPETEQSAGSHALTLARPLRHRVVGEGIHAVDGTPADCIYVALHHRTILPRRPALIVSGLNHGLNLGSDVFYSGTIAAAREGALRGIPSIAFSLEAGGDRAAACELAAQMVDVMLATTPPGDGTPLLNVNFPKSAPRGVRATRLGTRLYADDVVSREDPRGREYLWIGGPASARHEHVPGSDTEAIDEGYVSVTPLALEATHAAHFGLAAFVAALGQGGKT